VVSTKCAVITPVFWPVGAIAYPHHIARILKSVGHEVEIHTMDIKPTGDKIDAPTVWEGMKVIRHKTNCSVGEFAKFWHPGRLNGYHLVHFCGGYRHPHSFDWLFRVHDETKVLFSPFFPDKPRTNIFHKSVIPVIDKTLGSFMLQRCNLVLAETELEKEWLISLGVRHIAIVPNPLPDEAFIPYDGTKFKQKYNIHNKIVLYLGGHSYIKNVEELLYTMQFMDAHYVIGGEGELTSRYKEIIKGYGCEKYTTFPGSFFNNYQAKMEAFAAADVVVLTSRHEGLGTVLLEAMAQGKPVIASRVGGLPSVVPDDLCLYELGNKTELVSKLKLFLREPQLAGTIGKKGRAKAELYSYKNIRQRYLDIIDFIT
jgi:glycosyltransferase involved in cell wall biosynthesis